ncbi:hypothetical protein QUF72_00090 [Desulfobacterales bacterium HSG2]|nr:hypothetical protein [Desulfobacterales bacterium HSG2]
MNETVSESAPRQNRTVCYLASMSFDVFAGDILRALTNGGQMVICPSD